jgi:hypothetical protein
MKTVSLRCEFDLEQTAESFHAHAIPEDIEIYPGDMVMIHGAPQNLGFGEVFAGEGTATLYRAGMLGRAWTVFSSIFEVTELFEVGFQPFEPVRG